MSSDEIEDLRRRLRAGGKFGPDDLAGLAQLAGELAGPDDLDAVAHMASPEHMDAVAHMAGPDDPAQPADQAQQMKREIENIRRRLRAGGKLGVDDVTALDPAELDRLRVVLAALVADLEEAVERASHA